MPDDLYDELLAKAVKPERPSAVVEEDLLLRLEAEIDRHRSGDDVAIDGRNPAVVVELGENLPPARSNRAMLFGAVAAVLLLVIGYMAIIGPQSPRVETEVSEQPETPPESDKVSHPEELDVGAVESIDMACAEVLPGLAAGPETEIGTHFTPEAEKEISELLADLRILTSALDGHVQQLPEPADGLVARWQEHVVELENAELLFDQGDSNGLRFTLPTLVGNLYRTLDALVVEGAAECGTWERTG